MSIWTGVSILLRCSDIGTSFPGHLEASSLAVLLALKPELTINTGRFQHEPNAASRSALKLMLFLEVLRAHSILSGVARWDACMVRSIIHREMILLACVRAQLRCFAGSRIQPSLVAQKRLIWPLKNAYLQSHSLHSYSSVEGQICSSALSMLSVSRHIGGATEHTS